MQNVLAKHHAILPDVHAPKISLNVTPVVILGALVSIIEFLCLSLFFNLLRLFVL